MARVPYKEYDPRQQTGWEMTADASGATGWEHKKVRELWVFSRIIDGWGSREFMVYNPRNQHYVSFIPAGYISAKRQIQATASATGVFGKHAEELTYTTALTLMTGGLGGVAGLTGAGVRAVVGRIGVDATIQFAGGLMAHGLSLKEAVEEINFTSAFLAGVLPGGKMLGSFRNNAIGAFAELKISMDDQRFKWEYANFSTLAGFTNYLQKIAIGVGADYATGTLKLKLSRVRGGYASAASRSTKDVNKQWLYKQSVQLVKMLEHGIESSKSVGEGLSNIIEDALKPPQVAKPVSKK